MDKKHAIALAQGIILSASRELLMRAMIDIAGALVEATSDRNMSDDELLEQVTLLCSSHILTYRDNISAGPTQ